jgi:phospholipid/cholesterol/gamma-HCH transport system substrate-binding protein
VVPSQKQVKWSQLKVGITVLVASIVLMILIFLMNQSGGVFTRKITVRSYFDNASGLVSGAPVRFQGVDVGKVSVIKIVPTKQLTPVEVDMKIVSKYREAIRKDSVTSLETAGVLGSTYVEIDSAQSKGPVAQDGDTLNTREHPDFNDVVRSSQSTLQNMDALIKRLDRIIAFVESGQGSIGKLIYDPGLYNRLNTTLNEFQTIASDVSNGKGSLGKLVASDELYQKANGTVDKLNLIIDDIQAGKGTAGKFLKDPTLYNNANETIANVKKFTDDVNAGKGALGKLTRDEEFAAKLQNTMNKLSSIADQLESGQGTMGKLLKDPSLYTNTDQMLIETRGLVKAIRENPKRYLTIRMRVF